MSPIGVRTQQALVAVLAEFGVVPDEIHDIRTGGVNKHWRIDEGDRTFALRRYNPERGAAAIEYEHAMLTHLAKREWPIAAAIPSCAGSAIIWHDGAAFSLFPFLGGRPAPYGSARYLRTKGRLLARLHSDMAEAPLEGQRPGFARIWELDRHNAARFTLFDDLLRVFSGEHRREASVIRAQRRACQRELSRLGYDELPDTFVHCDYHSDNLLFDKGKLSALLDFDSLHRDVRSVDIAWAIVLDCREPPQHNAISLGGVEALVGGYHAVSPLGASERALIVPLIRAAYIAGATMRLRQWEHGPDKLRLYAPQSIRRTVDQRFPALDARRAALEAAVAVATDR